MGADPSKNNQGVSMRTVRILFASLFVLLSSHTSFAKTLFVVPTSPEPAQVSILTGTVTSPNLPKVVLSRPWISADSGHYSVRVPINGVQYRIRAVGPNTLDVSTAWRGSVEKKGRSPGGSHEGSRIFYSGFGDRGRENLRRSDGSDNTCTCGFSPPGRGFIQY